MIVLEKLTPLQRLARGLIEHITATTGERRESYTKRDWKKMTDEAGLHSTTSEMLQGPSVSRNFHVPCLSNFGSMTSMQRKKRSMDARRNSGTLKTG